MGYMDEQVLLVLLHLHVLIIVVLNDMYSHEILISQLMVHQTVLLVLVVELQMGLLYQVLLQ